MGLVVFLAGPTSGPTTATAAAPATTAADVAGSTANAHATANAGETHPPCPSSDDFVCYSFKYT